MSAAMTLPRLQRHPEMLFRSYAQGNLPVQAQYVNATDGLGVELALACINFMPCISAAKTLAGWSMREAGTERKSTLARHEQINIDTGPPRLKHGRHRKL